MLFLPTSDKKWILVSDIKAIEYTEVEKGAILTYYMSDGGQYVWGISGRVEYLSLFYRDIGKTLNERETQTIESLQAKNFYEVISKL
jgi:hypothetical protein